MATHYIAAVHMSGGNKHEHVAELVSVNGSTFKGEITSTAVVVDFIEKGGDVRVSDGTSNVAVAVVRPQQGRPYLRTHKDKKWTDNLLAVPRY